jgi:hypothetical protein
MYHLLKYQETLHFAYTVSCDFSQETMIISVKTVNRILVAMETVFSVRWDLSILRRRVFENIYSKEGGIVRRLEKIT